MVLFLYLFLELLTDLLKDDRATGATDYYFIHGESYGTMKRAVRMALSGDNDGLEDWQRNNQTQNMS